MGFSFGYVGKSYSFATIGTNGYVCLNNNGLFDCWQITRPAPYDILVGLNFDLDQKRGGSIYYKTLVNGADFFNASQADVNLLNADFVPTNIFMFTYLNVLAYDISLPTSVNAFFQIILLTDSTRSFVVFRYTSCLDGQTMVAASGLDYNYDGLLKEKTIVNPCTSSNVGVAGKWVFEVTNSTAGKKFFLFWKTFKKVLSEDFFRCCKSGL